MDGTTLQIWNEKADTARLEYLGSKYLYKSIIDGGDTDELMELVNNAWGNGVWQTRQTLMAQSPYVSEAVLENLAKQCPSFPYSVALEVLLANPSPTMTEKFLLMLETETTFPQYMIDMVATNTGQSTYRDELEENLAKSHMAYIEAEAPIIRHNWRADSITTTERMEALEKLESASAELQIIDLLLSEGSNAEALERCDSLESKFGYNTRVKKEQDAMYEWMDVITSNSSLENLSSADIATLDYLAANRYYTVAGKKAIAVLNHYYHEDHFIPPYYGTGSASVRSLALGSNASVEDHLLTVFPNPASELIQLKLSLGNIVLNDEFISILDATGRLLETIKVTNGEQQLVVDTRLYAAGRYQAVLNGSNGIIESISFNVVH